MSQRSNSSSLRVYLLVFVLVVSAIFLRTRSGAEVLPQRSQLSSFPLQLGEWTGRDVSISESILKILGSGEFLHRVYMSPSERIPVDFFLAYFPSQRTGSTIHSPKNCLPGAGWVPVDSAQVPLRRPDGQTIVVNRYIIAKGPDRQLVLYWYQAHGRVVASEYWAKFYLVADAMHLNRSDGALVRVMTPLAQDESVDDGLQRTLHFGQLFLPILDQYIPI
ncbi:MAG: exosortase C-terminal domain/associated protein EpsI [Terriglobia bacterium]